MGKGEAKEMTYVAVFVLGAWVGILVMCLMFMAKDGDQEGYRE